MMISNTEIKQKITEKLENLTTEELMLIDHLLTNLNSYFEQQKNLDKVPSSGTEKQELIKSLQGKYAHAATSSDDFARRKQEEIDWEERNR
jgi:hypothetical protein